MSQQDLHFDWVVSGNRGPPSCVTIFLIFYIFLSNAGEKQENYSTCSDKGAPESRL